MKLDGNISFLGAGNIAGALIKGLLSSRMCGPDQIMASDIDPQALQRLGQAHGITTTGDNRKAAAQADILVLSTKPKVLARLLPEIATSLKPTPLVISVAAGVPIGVIESHLPGGTKVVRAMPNTPALVQASATALAAGTHANAEDIHLAQEIFRSVGLALPMEESLMDAVTGLSGSGPAYVFVVIEALADAGVEMGLPRQAALELATHTVLGSAQLVASSGEHPAALKDRVASPGGTTIAGLQALEAAGLRKALGDAVRSATLRSRALGEQTAAELAGDKG